MKDPTEIWRLAHVPDQIWRVAPGTRSWRAKFRHGRSSRAKFRAVRRVAMALAMLIGACSPGGVEPPLIGAAVEEGDLPLVDVVATVTSVADGDSFRASADGRDIEIRLLGINAPERGECYGPESAQWLVETIDGREIGLAVEAEKDQFDRTLAIAVLDTTNVNVEAVATGHALVVSEVDEDRETFIEAEERARSSGIGMWGNDICGANGPKAALEIVDIDYNPSGPDDVETVTIGNAGAESINLSGFTLRDESSTNRYPMPTEVLAPGASHVVRVIRCDSPESHGPAWCSEEPVWNNGGDTALLLDTYGRIVAVLRY